MYKINFTLPHHSAPVYNAGLIFDHPIYFSNLTEDDILIYEDGLWVTKQPSAIPFSGSITGPTGPSTTSNGEITSTPIGPGTPGMRFSTDTDTGIYLPSSNQLATSCGGTSNFNWNNSLITLDSLFNITSTSPEALLVRKDGDTGDVVTINTSNTTSTSTTTGALVVDGGVGVSGTATLDKVNTNTITSATTLTINPTQMIQNNLVGVMVNLSSPVSINVSTNTPLTWDNVIYNNAGYITTPSSTITIPSGLGGTYLCICQIQYTTEFTTTENIQSYALVNGSTTYSLDSRVGLGTGLGVSTTYQNVSYLPLSATNTLQFIMFHTRIGGATIASGINVTNLSLIRIYN
jgi:hypothetical protein